MTTEQAVRILAGTFVGVSLIGALTHSMHWLWLAGFVSANLIQSSFTGICPAEWIFQTLGLESCAVADEEAIVSRGA